MPITQADIDDAVAQIEVLRGPLDDALRRDTRQLDQDIRKNVAAALRNKVDAATLTAVLDQLERRADPAHTDDDPDADKLIHMRERQFGSQCKQIVNRLAAKL